jgi:hypothetical protein
VLALADGKAAVVQDGPAKETDNGEETEKNGAVDEGPLVCHLAVCFELKPHGGPKEASRKGTRGKL